MARRFAEGDRLTHRFNPELGPGVVQSITGRTMVVEFPETESVLRLTVGDEALEPLVLEEGVYVQHRESGRRVRVEEVLEDDLVRLEGGEVVEESELWPDAPGDELFERLANGDIDRFDAFSLRLDSLRLERMREADGLGSFLGGRIQLFPHQLYVAERATESDPVRWLLADEVGLGKTVETCLILNHLLFTQRADRTLVIAPETLTVQWLGELWRKYHQVFVLLDEQRLKDVERDFGEGFNPFDAHHRVVLSQEMMVENPRLAEQAVEAEFDLVAVDEAHHLRRDPGHPGNPLYRAVAPLAAAGRHLLLLTATPLEDDAHGFFRLLQLLRPAELPDDESFEERLERGDPLPPCTSATRRADIGGLPPRVGTPIEVEQSPGEAARSSMLEAVQALPADDAVARRKKARRIRRALESSASLEGLLDAKSDAELMQLTAAAGKDDPRLDWLAERTRGWQEAGDKTLVFVARRESLEWIRSELNKRALPRVGVFHEDLSLKQRDIEVAQFRLPSGPSMMISTECGGEGRNFEFCTRMVLFDLPWNPMVTEQRVGRLDRIGRTIPVETVYFRWPGGLDRVIADLYERLEIFQHPLGAFERELSGVEAKITELALDAESLPQGKRAADPFAELLAQAREAYGRVEAAAYHELHRDPYRPEMADSILARVPEGLEELTQRVVLGASRQLGLRVTERGFDEDEGGKLHSIVLDSRAKVDSLPYVGFEGSFYGSFRREQAVGDDTVDYFASGHPLVEGLMAHLEESPKGRVALVRVREPAEGMEKGFGLVAIFEDGPEHRIVVVDTKGRARKEWAELFERDPFPGERVGKPEEWTEQKSWPTMIRALGALFEKWGRPVAVAGLRVG